MPQKIIFPDEDAYQSKNDTQTSAKKIPFPWLAEEQATPSLSEDILKTAEATVPRAVAGTVKGGLGSVETFAAKEIPELARAGYLYGKEKLDIIPPAERERALQQPIFPGQTPEQAAGLRAPITGLPTYKGVEKEIKEKAGKELPGFLGYEPKTVPGKIVESGITGAVQAIPGGLAGVGVRTALGARAGAGSELAKVGAETALGAGAGAGGELAGQLFEGHESEGAARLAGSLTGMLGTGAGSNAAGKFFNALRSLTSDNAAREKIAKAIAADFERGQSSFSPDQIKAAIDRGEPVSVFDMAGPETKKLIGQYADVSPANRQRAGEYNRFLNDRLADSGNRISDYLGGFLGARVDAASLTDAVERAGKITRDNMYEVMRADPSASAISLKDIGGNLVSRPLFKEAMRDAEKTAANNPEWNIKVPSFTPPREELVGLEKVPYPAKDIPGNISYWDQVKRELDSKINQAKRSNDTSMLASATSVKKELIDKLDNIVPSYKKARDAASETFQAASAPEAGYNFYGTTNEFRLKDIKDAMLQYSPDQKNLFAQGFASRIHTEAVGGKIASLNNKFTKDKNFQERVRVALGDDLYGAIKAKVAAENLLSKTDQIKFLEEKITPMRAGIGAAGAFAAAEGFAAGVSPEAAFRAAIAGTAVAGGKSALNALDRAIAERALPLALSQNPADLLKLAKMIEEEPATSRVLDKLNTGLSVVIPSYEKAYEESTKEKRPGRATGGKVARGMTPDMIIAAIKRAHNHGKNETEDMLNLPDESVAKALDIAKRGI